MYRLRQRKSIDESMIQSKANCQEKIESLNLQNGFENAIENAARRQSTVVLNEFKQLVEAANSEVMESHKSVGRDVDKEQTAWE